MCIILADTLEHLNIKRGFYLFRRKQNNFNEVGAQFNKADSKATKLVRV